MTADHPKMRGKQSHPRDTSNAPRHTRSQPVGQNETRHTTWLYLAMVAESKGAGMQGQTLRSGASPRRCFCLVKQRTQRKTRDQSNTNRQKQAQEKAVEGCVPAFRDVLFVPTLLKDGPGAPKRSARILSNPSKKHIYKDRLEFQNRPTDCRLQPTCAHSCQKLCQPTIALSMLPFPCLVLLVSLFRSCPQVLDRF